MAQKPLSSQQATAALNLITAFRDRDISNGALLNGLVEQNVLTQRDCYGMGIKPDHLERAEEGNPTGIRGSVRETYIGVVERRARESLGM